MMLRINFLAPILFLFSLCAESQKLNKYDKISLANLQAHVQYLSADQLQELETGMPGEKTAGDYIISELSKAGVRPKGDNNGWLQAFTIDQGREISANAIFSVNDHALLLNKEWFPLTLSPAGEVSGSPAIALQESGVPWFLDLRELLEAGAANSHFDLPAAIRAKAASCAKKGATALILYNSSSRYPDKLSFDPKDKPAPAVIPVLYITRDVKKKYLRDESASVDLKIRVGFSERQRAGHNVVGYLDNGAATTVIVGAHYDHWGHSEDTASNQPPSPQSPPASTSGATAYNGANDNASGVAAMLELARLLSISKLKNNNYLFIGFSGSEQGLYGSEYFAGHPVIDLKKVNYMIDLEMIGRLNDTTHLVTVGGFGTSSGWSTACNSIREKKYLTFRYDSSGAGPGDQAAFYRQQIPVLFFTTGPYPEYHRPGDTSDKINYPGEWQVVKYVYTLMETINNSRTRVTFTP